MCLKIQKTIKYLFSLYKFCSIHSIHDQNSKKKQKKNKQKGQRLINYDEFKVKNYNIYFKV